MNKVSLQTKFAYGLGQIAEQVKNQGFNAFLFFYFTQVLGLSGSLAGAAVLIALIFDAITDPIAGSLSDNWKSPRGRRHPFMYAAAVPLGFFWYLLFIPPSGLGQAGLFLWLTTFAILVRGAMTLYHVPHLALGAELSNDYLERTSIVTWRTLLAVGGGVAVSVISYPLFFPETDAYANGMLNPSGYPHFALFGAALMIATIWYSAWGTRSEIPRLPKAPENPEPFSFGRIFEEFKIAWENVSFRSVFIGFTFFGVFIGVMTTLGTHLNVFFWGFSVAQLSMLFIPTAIGFVIGVAISRKLHERFDKKPTLVVGAGVSAIFGSLAVIARLLGLMPSPGSEAVFPIVLGLLSIVGIVAGVGYTSAGSMMADVAQDMYARTGRAQQGILFAAVAFAGKVGSAGGHFVAGVGIDLIDFPLKADPTEIAPYLITRLGLLSLISFPVSIAAVWSYGRYEISRASYEANAESSDAPDADAETTASAG